MAKRKTSSLSYRRRLSAVRDRMGHEEIESLLIAHLPDVRYLCGFSGSNAILCITRKRAAMLTDGRYIQQAREETHGAHVIIAAKSAAQEACAWLETNGVAGCVIDPDHTTLAEFDRLRGFLPPGKRRSFFRPLKKPLVPELRLIKDGAELLLMEQAAKLGVKLFEEMLPKMRAGMTEAEVAGILELGARTHGADGMSFETIVASGPRSALPHGRATGNRLPRRGFVTLDFGVILKGYCSDMTRTVFLGKATRDERITYDAVREAQLAGVQAVKPGATCGDVDEAARSVLRKAKLAKYFTHSTGHGVGLEIHEMPRLAQGQHQVLVPGMVITVEPGVYVPGKFGVRIEDMVAVTPQGGKVLTPTPTAWIQL